MKKNRHLSFLLLGTLLACCLFTPLWGGEEVWEEEEVFFEDEPFWEESFQDELVGEEAEEEGFFSGMVWEDEGQSPEVTTEPETEATTEYDLTGLFTDKAFRKYVQGVIGQKVITGSKCELVTEIDVRGLGVKNLDGLSCFPNLTTLLCGDEDETKNVLEELDLSGNPKLEVLFCDNVKLRSLDLSKNPALKTLSCAFNLLRELDVSANPDLEVLLCYFNQMESLDVSGHKALKELHCGYGELRSLSLSGCENLETLAFLSNLLTEVDLTGLSSLRELSCSENMLTSLDVSMCGSLQELTCDSNQLESLTLGTLPELVRIFCYENHLTELDVSGCPALRELYCYNNELQSLDIRAQNAMASLNVADNRMESAEDVKKNTEPAWFNFEPQKADPFTLSPETQTLYLGTKQKTVTLVPSVQGLFTFSSSNKKVAKVSSKGVVTGLKKGTAIITVCRKSNRDVSATCIVTVAKPSITAPKKVTLKVGEKVSLNASALPAKKIAYVSADPSIATVSKKGVVKGKKKGTTTLTLTANKVTKTVKVKVTK